ncbi:MAG: T9SS type A sorting domain-containing protein [Flavobacteriales bacterium]|nr:T9SS type A sorting domain-containing protein [Flavobacteriales bacterium]
MKLGGDSLRIYFSSSEVPPTGGLDATVNTYSAVGTDGVNWTFEPGARVDHATLPIIDPAVIRFGPGWHYSAPKGAPQDGAHHYLSPNGIDFNQVPDIPSDPLHNWTGNFMIESPTELRFYGGGANGIWYNHSPNGGQWNGYVSTNLQGGDPSALKVAPGNYLIVYVGQPYTLGVADAQSDQGLRVYPVPAADRVRIEWPGHAITSCTVHALDGTLAGNAVVDDGSIDLEGLPSDAYLLRVRDRDGRSAQVRVVKE